MDWLGEGLSELAIERLDGHGLTVFTREERLDALEKLGLPAYAHFSRATMLKIAAEIDADYVIFGEFSADGGRLQLGARILRVSPPKLSNAIAESGALDALPQIGAQVAWQALCGIQELAGRLGFLQRGFGRPGGNSWPPRGRCGSTHFSTTCGDW